VPAYADLAIMGRVRISTVMLGIAGALQSFFVARGAAVNPMLAIAWAVVGATLLGESFWYSKLTKRWWRVAKISCLAVGVLTLGWFLKPLVVAWYYPEITFETGNNQTFIIKDMADDVYVRVRLTNNNWKDAACRLYLTSLVDEKLAKSVVDGDALQLWASNGGDGDSFAPLVLHAGGGSRLFDIVSILHKSKADRMEIASKQLANLMPNSFEPSSYIITIKANGSDCGSAPQKIRIIYSGGLKIETALVD
jgi:hypothetical protein